MKKFLFFLLILPIPFSGMAQTVGKKQESTSDRQGKNISALLSIGRKQTEYKGSRRFYQIIISREI